MKLRWIIGLDDGYFPPYYKGRKGYTILLGVKYSLTKGIIEGIAYTFILVDGLDATEKAIRLVEYLGGDIVLYDGITYAGFNVIDPFRIHSITSVPGIVFYRHPLSLKRISDALVKHFPDYKIRLDVIKRALLRRYKMSTEWGIYEYTPVEIDPLEAKKLLEKLQYYSPEPEPIRIADILSSKASRKLIIRYERARRDLNPGPTG